MKRAPGSCGQPGCPDIPVFNGRCRVHARWPSGNAARANGWAMSRLKALLIRRARRTLRAARLRVD